MKCPECMGAGSKWYGLLQGIRECRSCGGTGTLPEPEGEEAPVGTDPVGDLLTDHRPGYKSTQDAGPPRHVIARCRCLCETDATALIVSGPCVLLAVNVVNVGGIHGATGVYNWGVFSGAAFPNRALVWASDTAGFGAPVPQGGIRCERGLVVVRPSADVICTVSYAVEVDA